ncbi:uS15 family ribosomal protein [Enterobacteriaceae bacterium ET-AT1-13]|nr:uS15 family ribosomal protein [Enterobacteriaceae bacterium ET-AT1-13]WGS66429.1 uS15 family ribosomal protein [Enterobacteriaceae bacterium Cmel17]WMC17454.1 MAG: 30S ribosomal protein S15 [Enterobacteriaceae bacterium Cmel21]WMC17661.1 MAG: uS15 family ribosomal protein [Enterobacteriaceae bacterium PSmelAO3-2]WMC17865.1 MAG: uS15 family ribosomal protein [Enterobacteriaceae bacterium PSmelAO3-1]WMC18069.1 MAG: uS15 family ribosomal protein [Enterobacteriaceae bacterium PSmelAO1]
MNIIKKLNNTNYLEYQINIFNKKIEKLKKHFILNKKDKHSRIGLLKIIIQKKKLLKYLKYNNFKKYKIINKNLII